DYLRVAAAGRPALHAKHRSERRLAEAYDCLLADDVERIPQTYGRRRLALTGRRRRNRGDEHQAAVRAAVELADVIERHLRLEASIRLEEFFRDPQSLARDTNDGLHSGLLCYIDIPQSHRVPFYSCKAATLARQPLGIQWSRMLWLKALHIVFVVTWFAGL